MYVKKMGKAFFRKSIIIYFLIISLFLCSCGLYEYGTDMLYPPYDSAYRTGENAPDTRDFFFSTADVYDGGQLSSPNNQNLNYRGTSIYYKIYNSESAMNSERSSISSSNSEFSSNGAKKLISLGYKQLKYYDENKDRSDFYSIPVQVNDVDVSVRFITEGAESEELALKAGFYLDNEMQKKTNTSTGEEYDLIPYRNLGSEDKTFDFFNDEIDNLPKEDDEDVLFSESSDVEDGIFYIAGYAMSYGMNEFFNNIYSQVTSLGYIIIVED